MKPKLIILTLRDTGGGSLRGVPLSSRARQLLKIALRRFGLRCVRVELEPKDLEAGLTRVFDENGGGE